jgi:hypothetical protein
MAMDLGKRIKPARNIIETPKHQITDKSINVVFNLKYQPKFTIVNSTIINHKPLFKSQTDSEFISFFRPIKKAEVPDKKQKTGAQI